MSIRNQIVRQRIERKLQSGWTLLVRFADDKYLNDLPEDFFDASLEELNPQDVVVDILVGMVDELRVIPRKGMMLGDEVEALWKIVLVQFEHPKILYVAVMCVS